MLKLTAEELAEAAAELEQAIESASVLEDVLYGASTDVCQCPMLAT